MCQLPKLLQYFRVPPNASHGDLRQAYLQRAMKIHPDKSRAPDPGCENFKELQDKFELATNLMRQREQISSTHGAAAVNDGQGTVYAYQAYQARQHAKEEQKPQGVPTMGLPSQAVYSCAIAFAGAVAALWGYRQLSISPTVNQSMQRQKRRSSELSPHEQVQPLRMHWPDLQNGPWSVSEAKQAAQNSTIVWAPSKSWEFQEADNFYESRTRGRMRANVGQRAKIGQLAFESSHQSQQRDGVNMLPVHIAAEEGNIWSLEFCGASLQCRGTLDLADSVGNTPLHYSAKNGRFLATLTLLRLGACSDTPNQQNHLPLDLAKAHGHDEIVQLFRQAHERETTNGHKERASERAVQHHHPDGLGVHAKPPPGVVYTGLQDSAILRRAINMAAGCIVTPHLPITRGFQESNDAVERMINIARGSLQSTDFDIDDSHVRREMFAPSVSGVWASFESRESELCGLLVYESPGAVSPDAPGHWVAIRRVPDSCGKGFVRLDPVRGPFHMSHDELVVLIQRYRIWCVIRKQPA